MKLGRRIFLNRHHNRKQKQKGDKMHSMDMQVLMARAVIMEQEVMEAISSTLTLK